MFKDMYRGTLKADRMILLVFELLALFISTYVSLLLCTPSVKLLMLILGVALALQSIIVNVLPSPRYVEITILSIALCSTVLSMLYDEQIHYCKLCYWRKQALLLLVLSMLLIYVLMKLVNTEHRQIWISMSSPTIMVLTVLLHLSSFTRVVVATMITALASGVLEARCRYGFSMPIYGYVSIILVLLIVGIDYTLVVVGIEPRLLLLAVLTFAVLTSALSLVLNIARKVF